MDTQAERRNEVMGAARDLRKINTALTAGAIADRMAEQGQKTFTQGIKRIVNSTGIPCGYIL